MHILKRGGYLQKLGLASGLVLFLFAITHFLNHALGLVNLETMHEAERWRQIVTRSVAGSTILGAALVAHIFLGLWKLARRSTLRLPPWELIQIGLGLLIPFLLFPHIVNTRVAHTYFGVEDNYLYELARLWPASAVLQSTLLVMVWVHGCLGIHYWLRVYAPYRAAQPVLLFIAIAIPLAALGGFMVSGRAVAQLIENPDMFAKVKQVTHWPSTADGNMLADYRFAVRLIFGGILAFVASAIAWGHYDRKAAEKVPIKYLGGPVVMAAPGMTLLEISRANNIPHASVCGGRARCSTCRVRVEEGANSLPLPVFPETLTLASISAPHNVRLACQIRPTRPIAVTRLLRSASAGPQSADIEETDSAGIEKPLAVMFLDMREFTKLSQGKLPYDVVFLLNEFFAATGQAITNSGGWIDKFMGDGLLAVFGQHHGVEAGCRQALRAARAVDLALDHVNAKLESEVGRPLKIGMGIHAGPLLLGRIGYGASVDLTVIGNAVNVASRLESIAKEHGHQIVLSRDVARYAGWVDPDLPTMKVNVRGVEGPLEVIGIGRGRDLPVRLLAASESEDERLRMSGRSPEAA